MRGGVLPLGGQSCLKASAGRQSACEGHLQGVGEQSV